MQNEDNYIDSERAGGGKFDVLKFLLSIMIVMVHTKPLPDIAMPLLRLAVPLFFLMSSYFFFLKQKDQPENNQQLNLKKYVLRGLKLYLFWFIVLLPFTIVKRRWYALQIEDFIPLFFKKLLFGSTFPASWFLMASVIGVALVYYISKYLKNYIILIVGVVLYFFCCLSSNYFGIVESSNVLSLLYGWTKKIVGLPHNNFIVSIVWIAIGKIIAEKLLFICNKKLLVALFFSILLLYVEYNMLNYFELVKTNDCYIMLIPTAVLLFVLVGQNAIKIPTSINTLNCRKMSTIIYCIHIVIIGIVFGAKSYFHFPLNNVSLFLITLTTSMLVSLAIIKLEKVRGFNFLKYAY